METSLKREAKQQKDTESLARELYVALIAQWRFSQGYGQISPEGIREQAKRYAWIYYYEEDKP